jgi:hypothetical protein
MKGTRQGLRVTLSIGSADVYDDRACDDAGHARAQQARRPQDVFHLPAFVAACLAPAREVLAVVDENPVFGFAEPAFGPHHDAVGGIRLVVEYRFDPPTPREFGQRRTLYRGVAILVEKLSRIMNDRTVTTIDSVMPVSQAADTNMVAT